jgi:hypothetical protein
MITADTLKAINLKYANYQQSIAYQIYKIQYFPTVKIHKQLYIVVRVK